jgi:hypothetical protein
MRSFYIAAILLIFSSHSSAADYYWVTGSSGATHYASPELACKFYEVAAAGTFKRFHEASTSTVKYCVYLKPNGSEYWAVGTYFSTRKGDTCPPGQVINNQTGICEGDPCLPTVGQVVYHEHPFRNLTQDGTPDVDPPVAVCKNSCQYTHTFEGFSSNRDGKRPDQFLGSFKYKGNGVSCTVSQTDPSNFDQPPTKPPMSPEQEYFTEDQCDEWVTNADGTRSRNCVSKNYFNEPGKLNCVYGSGSMVCNVGSPSPYSKDSTTEQTTTEKTNPDGSKNTSTNSNTSTTTCKGMSKCVTTGKDETKGEETNPDGTPGDSTETCTGTDCDAKDDEKEEEEEEEPRTASASCNGPVGVVSCAGDAIDCAVLQEEANQSCQAKSDGDFPGKKADIESLVQGDKFTLQETTVNAPSIINSATRFLPASCPPPETISISVGSGSHSYAFKYDPICRLASDLSWIIVAIASIWAAVYVGRAFGGE